MKLSNLEKILWVIKVGVSFNSTDSYVSPNRLISFHEQLEEVECELMKNWTMEESSVPEIRKASIYWNLF